MNAELVTQAECARRPGRPQGTEVIDERRTSVGQRSLEARVESLQQEVAGLREDLQCLTRQLMSASDRQQLPATIKAAHDLMGMASWNAGGLAAAARKASANHPLLLVIAAHGAAGGGLRAFGKFLARCNGLSAGGFRLRKVGDDFEGCLYSLTWVSPPPKPSAPLAHASMSPHDGYSFVRSPNDPT